MRSNTLTRVSNNPGAVHKRQRVHPLPQQRPQLMFHPPRVPTVLKTGREACDQLHPPLGVA